MTPFQVGSTAPSLGSRHRNTIKHSGGLPSTASAAYTLEKRNIQARKQSAQHLSEVVFVVGPRLGEMEVKIAAYEAR